MAGGLMKDFDFGLTRPKPFVPSRGMPSGSETGETVLDERIGTRRLPDAVHKGFFFP
jgi:hypothetical protein